MTARFFVDTNVLIYAVSNAAADQAKRDLALQLLARDDIAVSGQILAEFYVVATSNKVNLTHDEAVLLLRSLAEIPVCPITRELVLEAIDSKQRFGISYWDAAVLAAAKQMGCATVYSEDLNAGQDYDGVTVVNPFATAASP